MSTSSVSAASSNMHTRGAIKSSMMNDVSDIAKALGIQDGMFLHKYAITQLIEYVHTEGALTPEIISVLSSQLWADEDPDIVDILRPKVSGNLANCVRRFAITLSSIGTAFFDVNPSTWMWFPTREDHISALAFVLMLYLFFDQQLPRESDPAKRGRMILAYYTSLEFLRGFRCRMCGGDYEEDEMSKSGPDRVCNICTPEEGEIVESPQALDIPIPYCVCTHRNGDPECMHF
ncbi:hypothetical protein O1611_g2862 [Lasiodiplodia mahajangana]|uniref:Uncharacterized protein n=1 Tax=Lasiodiplodia mahajangana TaxID=1108764 RepID=A0ACC2JTN7_9PEZI|nr:hypothetical protein O1611_g2862 [Lasiodiplodia mahajangana]